ncbi:uncharacterized protein LOC128239418 [Mya arenaria]|uniref:uncharacterized protein LOC128239418 n=1 Tax=Mya arenaria TaxID=6604 RepID=UPI0022E3BD17|nr:uncharacterized protein LOC128239418 [Mya arenaria]
MDLLVKILNICFCVSIFVQEVLTVQCNSTKGTTDLFNAKIRSCNPSEIDDGIHVNVTCPNEHVIADLEVTSGIFNDKCTGKTKDLIVAVNNCYWNNSCSLALPKTKMITCESEADTCLCFMQNPDFLVVTRAKCVKQSYIKDFRCRGPKPRPSKKEGLLRSTRRLKKGGLRRSKRRLKKEGLRRSKRRPKKPKETLQKVGLLRSHETFPWFYRKSNSILRCKQRMRRENNLVLDWKVNDICEIDGLNVKTGKVRTEIFDSNQSVITKGKKTIGITFRRSQKDDVDSGCGGFLMCYIDIKQNVSGYVNRTKWACDDIMDKNATIEISTRDGDKRVRYSQICPSDVATIDCCPQLCE